MIYVLLFMLAGCGLFACLWAVGVGSTVYDHEEELRGFYEWEEPKDE